MDNTGFAILCRRQYAAAIDMLRKALTECPPSLWNARNGAEAPFWQYAMHTLFYARLYLSEAIGQADDKAHAERMMRLVGNDLKDWSEREVSRIGATMCGMTSRDCHLSRTPTPAELLAELAEVEALAQRSLGRLEDGTASPDARNPMPWMRGTRADLLLYNLAHIQYHLGRLNAMLGRRAGLSMSWQGGLP